jgi:UDP-hydrolysing UDP-N-acetyl-D-glucosamine 2-epimerase
MNNQKNKKILFPCTNRVHKARQQLLLKELKNNFELDIVEYPVKYNFILNNVADIANYFRKVLGRKEYDLVIVRGDRYEVLPIAMLTSYRGIPMAHIEGGDISGAIDNKVRKAITALSDIHFATNKESYKRLIEMGTDPDLTFNFGSLDVEYAKSVNNNAYHYNNFVVICYHPMENEDPEIVENIVREEHGEDVIVIKSNKDNGTSYGQEEYTPESYIDLMAHAKCLVGNSSSFLKEASIFGTPVVNIGNRQKNRLVPENVINVPYNKERIRDVFKMQVKAKKLPSNIYYKPDTSKNITKEIIKFLS